MISTIDDIFASLMVSLQQQQLHSQFPKSPPQSKSPKQLRSGAVSRSSSSSLMLQEFSILLFQDDDDGKKTTASQPRSGNHTIFHIPYALSNFQTEPNPVTKVTALRNHKTPRSIQPGSSRKVRFFPRTHFDPSSTTTRRNTPLRLRYAVAKVLPHTINETRRCTLCC